MNKCLLTQVTVTQLENVNTDSYTNFRSRLAKTTE